jgi:hypothetical protein
MWLTWLADVLRGAGLTVIEEPGWERRGFAHDSSPGGALVGLTGGLVHHTGGSAAAPGDYPLLRYITYVGRSDAPPPLSQLGLGRAGAWYVLAAGRANHSGAVDDPRWANPRCVGVEAEHPGGTTPWPAAQYRSYVTGCAAIALYSGITWRGHREAAVPAGRKPDPNFDLDKFRADVAMEMTRLRDHGRAVQNALNALGFKVDVDGVVGPRTVAATRLAQAALGLVQDDWPGPVTLRALRDAALPPAPTTEEDPMALSDADIKRIWAYRNPEETGDGRDAFQIIRDAATPEHVRAAVADALAGLDLKVTNIDDVTAAVAAKIATALEGI